MKAYAEMEDIPASNEGFSKMEVGVKSCRGETLNMEPRFTEWSSMLEIDAIL